ncbi:MAG: acetyl-CoA C-acetyltransferase, partial [Gammaproteobacteria bacterium]|nr:acetyl-CoA C-acetyltransferase [Gammaproteobacteria bacterium]
MTKKSYSKPVYIIDGCRTPFLKARGKTGPFPAADLAMAAGRPLMERQNFKPTDLDEVIMGCVMPGPDEANIARVLALRLGCSDTVPAWTVQRNCASGMQALDNAAQNIMTGRSDLILAGGVESMSHAPVLLNELMVNWLGTFNKARSVSAKISALRQLSGKHLKPIIGLLRGLTDPVVGLNMGQTAEVLAHRFDISRTEMDSFAVESHRRLAAAQDNGLLEEIEIAYDRKGNYYAADDGLRRDTDLASLAKLKPVFDRHFGKVTAGNSAQVTDGAALLVLASEKAVKEYGLQPIGKLVDSHWAGLDPSQMGLGPAHAMAPILQKNKLKIDDVDFWEVNEAFATQVLACLKAWQDEEYCKTYLNSKKAIGEIPLDKLNVNGGGISLGHPVGASGARIVLHLLRILKHNNAERGIASLCIGGGQGGAMLVE